MKGAGLQALLPQEELKELLFSSSQEMEEVIPYLITIRKKDHEIAQAFRLEGTVFWVPDEGYLKKNEQAFPLALGSRTVTTSINQMKWLGHLLLTSRFPDEQYVLHTLSTFSLNPPRLTTPFFHYGHFYIYSVGAALQMGRLAGWVHLTPDKSFYLKNPGEVAKLFILGKWVGVLAAAMAIWVLFLTGRLLYDEKTGLLAAALFTFIPALAVEAHALKPWAFGQLWLCGTLYFSVKLFREGRLRDGVLAGILSGLAASSGLLFIYAFAAPLAVHGMRWRFMGGSKKWWVLAGVIGSGAAAAFLLTTPSLFIYSHQFLVMVLRNLANSPRGMQLLDPALHGVVMEGLIRALGVAAFAAAAGGIAVSLWRRRREDLFLLGGIAFYYMVYFKTLTFQTERHIMGILPLTALAGALFLAWLLGRASRIFRFIGMVACAGVLVFSFSETLFYDLIYAGDDSLVQAGRWVNANVAPGATVGRKISGDGHAHNYVPYRYFDYVQVNDVDGNLRRIKRELPDYYIALAVEEVKDPFLTDPVLRRQYKVAARFRHKVPLLGRFFKNRAAFYWVDEVIIFQREA